MRQFIILSVDNVRALYIMGLWVVVHDKTIGKKEVYMLYSEALKIIKDLSKSQGYYQRLYIALVNADDDDPLVIQFKSVLNGIHDAVDLVMYIEG